MIKRRVGLIENDIDIADVIQEVLNSEGFETLIYPNAVEFLKEIDSLGKLDFIFSDFYMPGITGGELCKELRSRQKYADIKFVLMSARKIKADELKALCECQFLQKPFSLDELLNLVKRS